MDYFLARYYSSAQGRFTSADSYAGLLTDPQTSNRYAYTRNNPVRFIDPSGHIGVEAIAYVAADLAIGVARGYGASVAGPFAPPEWGPSTSDSSFSLAGQVIGSLIAIDQGVEAMGMGGAAIVETGGAAALVGGGSIVVAGGNMVVGGLSNLAQIYKVSNGDGGGANASGGGPKGAGQDVEIKMGFPDKAAARKGLGEEGPLQVAANRFFRGATGKSREFQIGATSEGHEMSYFSPANNPGYGKRYVQVIDNNGNVLREYKETIGPNGIIETKWVHGGPK